MLLGRGIEAGTEHRLEHLVERLPMNDAWRASLDPWLHYSAYATAFRYPTPGGRIPSGPAATVILQDVVRLRALVRIVRAERPRGA